MPRELTDTIANGIIDHLKPLFHQLQICLERKTPTNCTTTINIRKPDNRSIISQPQNFIADIYLHNDDVAMYCRKLNSRNTYGYQLYKLEYSNPELLNKIINLINQCN